MLPAAEVGQEVVDSSLRAAIKQAEREAEADKAAKQAAAEVDQEEEDEDEVRCGRRSGCGHCGCESLAWPTHLTSSSESDSTNCNPGHCLTCCLQYAKEEL